jgi:hypothetical protein
MCIRKKIEAWYTDFAAVVTFFPDHFLAKPRRWNRTDQRHARIVLVCFSESNHEKFGIYSCW